MKPILLENLQFRDIWPRNRPKESHFLDFALLVFLDFAQAGMSSCFLTIRRSSQYILVLNQILLHN